MDKKIISGTIKDQVYKYLKDEICNRNFTPGHWLQELEIAQKLGVSRSPVREAIKHLAMDGLVIEIPNKGSYVREFTQKDVLDACDLRLMMETYALSQCKDNLTEKNLNALQEFLKEFNYHYEKDNLSLTLRHADCLRRFQRYQLESGYTDNGDSRFFSDKNHSQYDGQPGKQMAIRRLVADEVYRLYRTHGMVYVQ